VRLPTEQVKIDRASSIPVTSSELMKRRTRVTHTVTKISHHFSFHYCSFQQSSWRSQWGHWHRDKI